MRNSWVYGSEDSGQEKCQHPARREVSHARDAPDARRIPWSRARTARGVQDASPDAATDRGVGVEQIQDLVEMQLMKRGHYRVARRYIVYRAEHAKIRSLRQPEALEVSETAVAPRMHVRLEDGLRVLFDINRIRRRLDLACAGLPDCDAEDLLQEVIKSVFDGISVGEIYRAMILAARCRIERDPAYDTVAARLLRMVQAAVEKHRPRQVRYRLEQPAAVGAVGDFGAQRRLHEERPRTPPRCGWICPRASDRSPG